MLNCALNWWQFIVILLLHGVRMLLNYGPLMWLIFVIPRCFTAWWFVFPPFSRGINRSTPRCLWVLLFGNILVRIRYHRLRWRLHAIFVVIVHIRSSLLSNSRVNWFHKPVLNIYWSRHLIVRLCICCVYSSRRSNSFIEERSTSRLEASMSLGG